MRNPTRVVLSLALGGVIGCAEPKIELDEAVVEQRLGWIEESIPLCETRAAAPATRSVGRDVRRLTDLARLVGRARSAAPVPGWRSAGSCGGDVSVTSEHANGITDYVITFAAFCVNSDEGPLTVDGVVAGREEGVPTASGPKINALEVSTDGIVQVEQGGQTSELTVKGARTDYGLPNTWMPDAPDEEHPDVVTLDLASAVYPTSGGREDTIKGVRLERVGGSVATIRILDGQLATTGEGRVDLRTPEDDPVVVDLVGGRVQSGTLELVGAGDTVVAVAMSPTEPGVIEITLNGSPYPSDLDCSAGREPLIETAFTLLTLLPVH